MRSARTRKKQAEFYSESLSFIPLPQQGGQLGHAFGGAFADQGQRIADARRIGIPGRTQRTSDAAG